MFGRNCSLLLLLVGSIRMLMRLLTVSGSSFLQYFRYLGRGAGILRAAGILGVAAAGVPANDLLLDPVQGCGSWVENWRGSGLTPVIHLGGGGGAFPPPPQNGGEGGGGKGGNCTPLSLKLCKFLYLFS